MVPVIGAVSSQVGAAISSGERHFRDISCHRSSCKTTPLFLVMASRFGGAPQCPRCSTSVYMAEQVIGPGGAWHRRCLTCKECNKTLDSFTLAENNGQAYCKSCHSKAFGPKGYGYGGGGSFLSTETSSPATTQSNYNATSPSTASPRGSASNLTSGASPRTSNVNLKADYYKQTSPVTSPTSTRKWGPVEGDKCPSCSKTVYAAEAVLGGGKKFHKLCFKCASCRKMLDSTNITERESQLYCRGCYAKDFGPKGYGFGGGAAFLTTEGSAR